MSIQIATDSGNDRRKRRSLKLQEALHFQLLHATEMFELESMTLSQHDGELVAHASVLGDDALIGESLAAFSPLLADGRRESEKGRLAEARLFEALSRIGVECSPEKLLVCEFYAGGRSFCLSSIGGSDETRELILYRVIFGIRRIFNQMMG